MDWKFSLICVLLALINNAECEGNTDISGLDHLETIMRDINNHIKQDEERDVIFMVGSTSGWNATDVKNCNTDATKPLYPFGEVDDETGAYVVDVGRFQDASPESAMLLGFLLNKVMESSPRIKVVIVENLYTYFGGRLLQSLRFAANLVGAKVGSVHESVGLILTDCHRQNGLDDDEGDALQVQRRLQQLREDLLKREDDVKTRTAKITAPVRASLVLKILADNKKVLVDSQGENSLGNKRKFIFETLVPSKPTSSQLVFSALYGRNSKIHPRLLKKTLSAFEEGLEKLREPLLSQLNEEIGAHVQPLQRKIESVIGFCSEHLRLLAEVTSLEQLEYFARKSGVSDLQEIRFQVDKLSFLLGTKYGALLDRSITRFMSTIVQRVTSVRDAYASLDRLIEVSGSYTAQSFLWNGPRKWGNEPDWFLHSLAASQNVAKADGESFNALIQELWFGNVAIESKGAGVLISGRFLVLSALKDALSTIVGEVTLIAAEKIYVDSDLSLQTANLKLVAPQVEVIGPMRRTLQFKSSTAPDRLGKDLDCIRPKEANTFSLMALETLNGHLLQVKMEGGPKHNGCAGFEWGAVRNESTAYNREAMVAFVSRYKCTANPSGCVNSGNFATNRENLLKKIDNVRKQQGSVTYHNEDHSEPLTLEQAISKRVILSQYPDAFQGTFISPNNDAGSAGACPFKYFNPYFDERDLLIYIGRSGTSDVETQLAEGLAPLAGFKVADGQLLEQALGFYRVITKENIILETHPIMAQFLNLLFTSKRIFEQLTPQDFSGLVEFAELNDGVEKQAPCSLQSLHFLYTSMLQSVNQWRHVKGDDNMAATVAEYALLSLLETLESFLQGKQVVRLAALVDAQLARLNDVDKAIERVGKFESVKSEKQFFLDKIAAAEKLIQKVQQRKLEEQKKQTAVEFDALLNKTEKMKKQYEETDRQLMEHKKSVEQHLWKNIALGTVNTVSMLAGAVYPAAAYAGPVVSGVVNTVVSGPKELKYESKVIKAVQSSKTVFNHFKNQEIAHQKNFIDTARSILKDDDTEGFLKDENRKRLQQLLTKAVKNETNYDNYKKDVDVYFKGVDQDLTKKIADMKAVGDTAGEKKASEKQADMQALKYVAGSAIEAAKTVQQYQRDKAKLDQVKSAIQQNRQNLRELAEYEDSVQETFKPMLGQMVDGFEATGTGLKTQDEFERLFMKLDLKTTTRKCIAIVQKLTVEFFEKDEGFTVILTELQELLDVLIEAFDKIEELRYRTRLAEFVGRMSGAKCLSQADPAACHALTKMAAAVKTNELVRGLAQVLAAYQQTSFPYGAARMRALSATKLQLINATRLALRSAPRDQVAALLRSALETIRDDLTDSSTSTRNQLDADVVLTEFSNRFLLTRPYFSWRQARFPRQIARLLSGEGVTLEASAAHPDARNAAKFSWVALNVTSPDAAARNQLSGLLKHFRLEMVRGAESYFRCGGAVYGVDGAELNMTVSFERDERGQLVLRNRVHDKVSSGDVPLSPYALWRFRLVPASRDDPKVLFHKLALLAPKVDLELVGAGSYVNDGAAVCRTDLSGAYTFVSRV